MDDVVSPPSHPTLHRRNSIPSVPPKLSALPRIGFATTSSSSDDLEMLAIRPASHSYTSLRDLLPAAAVNSPKPKPIHWAAQSGSDICIRNRLVKQAAWAYLQPMSSSTGSDGSDFLRRLWPRVTAALDFVCRGVVRVFNWMLRIGSR